MGFLEEKRIRSEAILDLVKAMNDDERIALIDAAELWQENQQDYTDCMDEDELETFTNVTRALFPDQD